MAPKLKWDQDGERLFETGVDHGVLFLPNSTTGIFDKGYVWNGLTAVTKSPSGAEPNKQYADNRVYLNLLSNEEAAGTIEAFTYPPEFAICNGENLVAPGVSVGQQNRSPFGFSWRSKVGNDLVGQDFGYKIHLVWNALAGPSETAYNTINESPEAATLSWEYTTTPTDVELDGFKPTATLTINSTTVDKVALAALEEILYGKAGTGADGATGAVEPRLPTPTEVILLFADELAGTP